MLEVLRRGQNRLDFLPGEYHREPLAPLAPGNLLPVPRSPQRGFIEELEGTVGLVHGRLGGFLLFAQEMQERLDLPISQLIRRFAVVQRIQTHPVQIALHCPGAEILQFHVPLHRVTQLSHGRSPFHKRWLLMVHWGKEILREPKRQGTAVQISTKNPNAILLSKIHVAPVGHRVAV